MKALQAASATATRRTVLGAFVLGALPLAALAFFSPGLGAEGVWGYAFFGFGVLTLAGLIASAPHRRWLWALVAAQGILLGLVLYETFSDAALYVGT